MSRGLSPLLKRAVTGLQHALEQALAKSDYQAASQIAQDFRRIANGGAGHGKQG
jgi:hypothetical protein